MHPIKPHQLQRQASGTDGVGVGGCACVCVCVAGGGGGGEEEPCRVPSHLLERWLTNELGPQAVITHNRVVRVEV